LARWWPGRQLDCSARQICGPQLALSRGSSPDEVTICDLRSHRKEALNINHLPSRSMVSPRFSEVLRSDRAVQMSIGIIRAFVRMRELMASNKDIAARVDKLERGHERTASVIEILVEAIYRLAHEVKDGHREKVADETDALAGRGVSRWAKAFVRDSTAKQVSNPLPLVIVFPRLFEGSSSGACP
jgi:hypothetical protein